MWARCVPCPFWPCCRRRCRGELVAEAFSARASNPTRPIAEEIQRRVEATLRAAFNTPPKPKLSAKPHKPQSEMRIGAKRRQRREAAPVALDRRHRLRVDPVDPQRHCGRDYALTVDVPHFDCDGSRALGNASRLIEQPVRQPSARRHRSSELYPVSSSGVKRTPSRTSASPK
jgi:hypothetical protein